ncbi:MAG: DNA-binding transcriptional repressor DeoR [[Pasteurella] mairii]|uniref:DeoR family transcriptional regulator n=1 Tax=[Pasteurella] mairii TaxID=757 RepID=A0A379B7J5_9PAST|nr:DNA-binding transcriptional repressor DeoR [[Pasteurella] mairii]SUB34625.1 DeoR family transcriptional regulator [[Pasteurella] mairii]
MEKVNPRIKKLEFLLKQMGKIHLRDAAEILNVSEMTIRRDLSVYTGSISLLGGYIVKEPGQDEHRYFIHQHQTKNIAEKMYIGKLAAELIKDGDVVFFDCGSTIPYIASQIDSSIKFTALCCSLNTFMVLQENLNCELILCGGRYSRNNSVFSALGVGAELGLICPSKAFISAAGVDLKKGVTCFDFDEAKIKAMVMEKSQQNILVFDHSKLEQVQCAYIGKIEQFDLLISDQALSSSMDKLPPIMC